VITPSDRSSLDTGVSSNPGIEFNFASNTDNKVSNSVILEDISDSFFSHVFEKVLRNDAVFTTKLFTAISVFCIAIGFS
jgi:hypothetical protein